MDLHCDDANMLVGVLPHETTHVVLAGRFGRHLVPRGSDQGVQGGNGDLGGTSEDEPHGWVTASRAGVLTDPHLTGGAESGGQHTSL